MKSDFSKYKPGEVGLALVKEMPALTALRIKDTGLENAKKNLRYKDRGESLQALTNETLGYNDSALVIAAGPSIKRQDGAKQLIQGNYKGAVIAAESAMLYCLRHGIVPDLVLTVDPHDSRIVRWFGDPELTQAHLEQDDYFSRQDMDESFVDQIKANEEVYQLVNKFGPQMKIAVSTSASEAVVNRVIEAGMQIYWWNPMYDDPNAENSVTRELYRLNQFPCLNAGGNVGAACWMMADAVLKKKHIGVMGMDFGYYADVPYKNTQYFYEAVDLVGEDNLNGIFIDIYNPHLDKWFYTDPAYMWYKQSFLEMVANTDSQTYNCTEGGILFGEGIDFISLQDFLKKNF